MGFLRLSGADGFAEHFKLTEMPGALRVETNRGEAGRAGQTLYLIPKGKTIPAGIPEGSLIIRTPVEKMVALSTTYLAALVDLGVADRIIGVGSTDRVTTPELRRLIDAGSIVGIGESGSIDLEKLALMQPDVVFMSAFALESFPGRGQLERMGIPVVATAAYLEPHPLGRAEWIRFFGAFTEKTAVAEERFGRIARGYEAIRNRVIAAVGPNDRPRVLTGAPWGGVWYCAGGGGYLARLIEDAGGAYVWEDASIASIPRDLETVLSRAGDADFWIHVGTVDSRGDLLSIDRRFRLFKAWRENRIFNNDRGVAPGEGVPFWERGAHRPDEVIADLASIFHPDRFGQHDPRYYRQLP